MLRREFLLGTAAALVTAGCGGGQPPTQPTPPPQPTPTPTPTPTPVVPPTLKITRILAFGDSMTWGTVSQPPQLFAALDAGIPESYPNKLQSQLGTRYSAQTISVFNAGSPGNRATQSGERDRLARAIRDCSPELVILLEGANDLNNISGSTNAFIDSVAGAMEDMVREVQGRGLPVFVSTLPEQRPGQPNTQNAALVPRYNSTLASMCGKKGATLVDLYAMFPLSLIGRDGLHPTELGYDKFAEIFLDAIRQRYEAAPAPG